MTSQHQACEPWWMMLPDPDGCGCIPGFVMLAVFDVWCVWFILHVQLGWWT